VCAEQLSQAQADQSAMEQMAARRTELSKVCLELLKLVSMEQDAN